MIISFIKRSWDEYNSWEQEDKKIFNKIQRLIKETLRDPFGGIGKPEPLKKQSSRILVKKNYRRA